MNKIEELVTEARAAGASDIHFIEGLPPKYRLDGRLESMRHLPLTAENCVEIARFLAGAQGYRALEDKGEYDGAETYAGNRCRVHIFKSRGVPSTALRLLREDIPKLWNLGLPPAAESLTALRKGIVLVTGETGSGKSTTLAGMIDAINHTYAYHIVTLEDPVEYI